MNIKQIDKETFIEAFNESTSKSDLAKRLNVNNNGLTLKIIDELISAYHLNIEVFKNNKQKEVSLSICPYCGKEFKAYNHHGKRTIYCSRDCANKHLAKPSNDLKKEKQRKSLMKNSNTKTLKDKGVYDKNPNLCPICNGIIPYEKRMKKTCSVKCGRALGAQNNTYKNCGGYRKGSSRGKHGYYKGIYCDSTYELAYLIYCLDHNIPIERCKETFKYEYEGKIHTYHPDFVVDGKLVEIKGYKNELVDVKALSVDKPYKILYCNDLIHYFDYVSKTYHKTYKNRKNNFYELYDEYKPQYKYTCHYCGKEFERNKKSKSDITFCSNFCSGKFRATINHKKVH